MRLEQDQFWGYFEWLFTQQAWLTGTKIALVLLGLGLIISYLISLARSGPSEGFYRVSKTVFDFFKIDLPKTSVRRIYAIARLAFKEAIRRKIFVILGLFVGLLMFAGWFLDPKAAEPAKLYMSWIFGLTNLVALLLGLFISCFSLPNEIKNKTIYSIVTKPVRPTELIIGRIVGFGAVGTINLMLIGILGYVFVVRGVQHTHDVAEFTSDGFPLVTTMDNGHQHQFEVQSNKEIETDEQRGHYHSVMVTEENGKPKYVIGAANALVARVPIYTKGLRFTNANGEIGDGVNVGYESEYMKYIEGSTLASAIWTFEGVTREAFPNGLNLEMSLGAFRTYKGDIEKGIRGVIFFRRPSANAREAEDSKVTRTRGEEFMVKEFQSQRMGFPIKMEGFKNNEWQSIDLFEDLVEDGKIEVVVRCLDQGQYFGMAPAALYLRAGDASFTWNFTKGFISIWLQMMIVICFGVMFSTFLSGAVGFVATISLLVIGYFGSIPTEIYTGKMVGGGPIESLIRIPTQLGVMAELDLGNEKLVQAIQSIDRLIVQGLILVDAALPDFGKLGTGEFVSHGINIFDGLLMRHVTIAFCYFIVTTLVGYFFLKTKEMAA